MADSYTQIFIQYVFAVKGRDNILNPENREKTFKYISGIISGKGQKTYAINGPGDHVHILVSIKPTTSVADLIRDIKNGSSKYINEKLLFPWKFGWQAGYGAFSYSKSQVPKVCEYIENQVEHHRHKTFKEEYLSLLNHFGIRYDENLILADYGGVTPPGLNA